MNTFGCFRCGQIGHYAAACPMLRHADTQAEHMDRIAFYVDRWLDGHMNREQKRCAIASENQLWYGEFKCPKHLTYP